MKISLLAAAIYLFPVSAESLRARLLRGRRSAEPMLEEDDGRLLGIFDPTTTATSSTSSWMMSMSTSPTSQPSFGSTIGSTPSSTIGSTPSSTTATQTPPPTTAPPTSSSTIGSTIGSTPSSTTATQTPPPTSPQPSSSSTISSTIGSTPSSTTATQTPLPTTTPPTSSSTIGSTIGSTPSRTIGSTPSSTTATATPSPTLKSTESPSASPTKSSSPTNECRFVDDLIANGASVGTATAGTYKGVTSTPAQVKNMQDHISPYDGRVSFKVSYKVVFNEDGTLNEEESECGSMETLCWGDGKMSPFTTNPVPVTAAETDEDCEELKSFTCEGVDWYGRVYRQMVNEELEGTFDLDGGTFSITASYQTTSRFQYATISTYQIDGTIDAATDNCV